MATSETEAGVDLLSKHPSKEVELRYRISVDDSGTKATLANIVAKRASGATDGGSLMFSTDAVGGDLAQRLVIDEQGKVGIGTENPRARLEVAGDAKFNGPLSIQGALTINGGGQINGNLSVTGKLTAGSFTGDGAELSNVTPADNSVSSAKLALDAASLRKVTDAKMVISGGKVGIGTENPGARLDVAGDAKFSGPLSVQGDLLVEGVAEIFDDLDVTGRLTVEDNAMVTGQVGIGVSEVKPDSTTPTIPNSIFLDVGSRMRVRQRVGNTSGIWFHQLSGGDKAFVGMVDDNKVGFWSQTLNRWGLTMNVNNNLIETGSISAIGTIGVAGTITANQGLFSGSLICNGAKLFKIDHPLDPANKYLNHWCVESPNIMNIYNGNVITDAEGSATVALPEYFDALNSDIRYQLTAIGKPALASVEREIENNSFTIRTNQPDVKVSWQVTGIRHDAWARVNRVQAEEEKAAAERGLYVHPEYFGQPKNKRITFVNFPGESEGPVADQT